MLKLKQISLYLLLKKTNQAAQKNHWETLNMSANMSFITKKCFSNATCDIDTIKVQKLVLEALQEIENEAIEKS